MTLEQIWFLCYKKLLVGRGTDGHLDQDYKKKNTIVSANEDKKYTKKNMGSIGDAHIVKHVHFIFRRAKRKWKDDVSLHLAHAAFAKQARSYKELGKIYAEALQIHPRNTSLWIEAASHEFFWLCGWRGWRKGKLRQAWVHNNFFVINSLRREITI